MPEKVKLVDEHREEFGLNRCCEALGLSKSSWYWAQRDRPENEEDEELYQEIVAIIDEHPGYGRRRITPELSARMGKPINEKRVRRLLDEYDLSLRRSLPKHRPSPIERTLNEHRRSVDLVKGRTFDALDVFSTDFTELVYAAGTRKAHLMTFVDIVSKWAPGWALGTSADTELALQAWSRASEGIARVRGTLAGVIVHHDMDSVYKSYDWVRTLLLMDAVRISYSENGAKDNPWIESMWGRLKVENRSLFHEAESLEELTEIVEDRLVYYNERRRHSELQYQPPIEWLEQQLKGEDEAPSGIH